MVTVMETSMETKAAVPAALSTERSKFTNLHLAYGVLVIVLAYAIYHIVY